MGWKIPAWSVSQRGVLAGFVLLVTIALGVWAWRNPSFVSDPQPDVPARFNELADEVDPNEADWQTLASLPQLGEKRAKLIVEFRENYIAAHPGNAAFNSIDDLLQIRGIGKVMIETIGPYLTFPGSAAATRSSGR